MSLKIDNKIRLSNRNIYTIEVNDKGDTIQLDFSDLNLLSKFTKTFKELENLGIDFSDSMREIEKEYSSVQGDKYILEKESKQYELLDDFYNKSRTILDVFLGKGACQKIFGSSNYITMFDDLADALSPCIGDMKKSFENHHMSLRNKYGKAITSKKVKL